MYFYLKTTNTKKTTLIYLKYKLKNEKYKFVISVQEKINPKDWDFNSKFVKQKKGRTDLSLISKKLNEYKEHLELIINNYKYNNIEITNQLLKAEFKKKNRTIKNNNNVFYYLDEFILEYKNHSKETRKKIKNIKVNLLEYQKWKNQKLSFDSFKNFKDYADFCIENYNILDNTINKHYSYIKTFVIWAYKKGLHDIRSYEDFKYKTYIPDTIALNKKQVQLIYLHKFSNNRLQKVIDVFLIGCYTGQRYSDFSVFDINDYVNGRIEKRQQKTKNKIIIPVDSNKKLKKILDKYNFNLPKISNQKYNVYLREALSEIKEFHYKVKKVSYRNNKTITQIKKMYQFVGSHTARRTFITITLEDKWTYKEVMQVSGITDIRTLMRYDKISNERLDNKTYNTWS